MEQNTSISLAVSLLGGPVSAARKLGVARYQTVQQWVVNGSVPPKYCPQIERLLEGAVRCEGLRPDIDWAYLRSTPAAKVSPGGGSHGGAG